jgi:hypothetical protein
MAPKSYRLDDIEQLNPLKKREKSASNLAILARFGSLKRLKWQDLPKLA